MDRQEKKYRVAREPWTPVSQSAKDALEHLNELIWAEKSLKSLSLINDSPLKEKVTHELEVILGYRVVNPTLAERGTLPTKEVIPSRVLSFLETRKEKKLSQEHSLEDCVKRVLHALERSDSWRSVLCRSLLNTLFTL